MVEHWLQQTAGIGLISGNPFSQCMGSKLERCFLLFSNKKFCRNNKPILLRIYHRAKLFSPLITNCINFFSGLWRMETWSLLLNRKTYWRTSRESTGNLLRTKRKVIGGLLNGLHLVKTLLQMRMTGGSLVVSGMVTSQSHPRFLNSLPLPIYW
jgi:hypothetical protein